MALISLEAISDEVHTQRRLRQRRLRLPLRTPGVGADDDHDMDLDDELSDMPSASLGTCRCCVHRFNYWRSGVVVSRRTANSLLQELHWLPVEQRTTYKLAVLTYKTRQTSVPEYLSRHITTRSSTWSLRSSSAPLLHVPFRRTSFGKHSFSTAAPSVWNSLPVSVQNCDTLTLFKSRLKAHLFSSVYAS